MVFGGPTFLFRRCVTGVVWRPVCDGHCLIAAGFCAMLCDGYALVVIVWEFCDGRSVWCDRGMGDGMCVLGVVTGVTWQMACDGCCMTDGVWWCWDGFYMTDGVWRVFCDGCYMTYGVWRVLHDRWSVTGIKWYVTVLCDGITPGRGWSLAPRTMILLWVYFDNIR